MKRRTQMLTDAELAEVLKPEKLNLPERPKVVDIKFEDHEDWDGEQSLEVYAILDDATPDEQWNWEWIAPTEKAVHNILDAAGESRFFLFSATTREDYDRRNSNDPEEEE